MQKVKKILAAALKILVIFFALVGAYRCFILWQYHSVKQTVEKREADRTYDRDLKYSLPHGEPIFLVDASNRTTLFFIDGFRGQAGAGHYRAWFEALHRKGINIVAPVTALQGWPFAYRTREWHREEDMRQALQIYDAYCTGLPKGHRVVVGSMSFGALSNTAIGAKGRRKPYAMVFVSPLNTGLDYKSESAVVRWLSTKAAWLQYIMPWMIRGKGRLRATPYDIVNDEKNLAAWNSVTKDTVNWEENLPQGVELNRAAVYMENDLVPQVKNQKVYILYGDSDLTFSIKGFESLAGMFRRAGNSVKSVCYPRSGHMLLYDNGGDAAKKTIEKVLGL